MRRLASTFALTLVASAQTAAACSYLEDERTPNQIRAQSQPVAVDRQCRVINGGVHDTLTLGRAESLGNGRFQQVIGDYSNSRVYVADCNTREATILRGTATLIGKTSCGPDYKHADLAGPDAMMSLREGANLHELVEIATGQGVTEQNPITEFFEFKVNFWDDETHEVGNQDRFDLMCGCKLFYPNSPGGAE